MLAPLEGKDFLKGIYKDSVETIAQNIPFPTLPDPVFLGIHIALSIIADHMLQKT